MNKLKINGKEREFPAGKMPLTIAALLDILEINQATVVAEVDGDIVERKNFGVKELFGGEEVELIRFVGGG